MNIIARTLNAQDFLAIAGIALSSLSTVAYGFAAMICHYKIYKFEKTEALRRRRDFEDDTALLTEDELTRQQLLSLLQGNLDRAPGDAASRGTYRIDLPGMTRNETAPQTEYEREVRRQLIGLLLRKDIDRAPSPDVSQETFHINLPDSPASKHGTLLLQPQSAYDRKVIADRGWGPTNSPAVVRAKYGRRDSSPLDRELRRLEIERQNSDP